MQDWKIVNSSKYSLSCCTYVFHRCRLVLAFQYLHFPPLHIRTYVFRTCIFHPPVLSFSVLAFSVAPGCSIQYTAAAVRSVSWTDHRRDSNRRAIAGVLVFARFHRDRYRAFPVDCVRLFPDMRVRPRIYTLMTTSTHRLARKLATN